MGSKKAIIIGAGPAGLTAAYELLSRTDIEPIVLERSDYMGGISRTVNYKGNRIDIGGHRFFSKSDRVMNWWLQHLPMQSVKANANGHQNGNGLQKIAYQNQTRDVEASANGADPDKTDQIMLLRKRKSRIYFLRKFFDYPIRLSYDTLSKLGLLRTIRIGFSYMRSALFPQKNVKSLEQFFINRFGRELYNTFFKSYTEKVWGVPCKEISAEWGEQRIKGLSITKTLIHFFKQCFKRRNDVSQKDTETSLIEQFLYPKFGPGQMWEEVAKKVAVMGGTIVTDFNVTGVHCDGQRVLSVKGIDAEGREREFAGDYFFSTMAMKDLVQAMDCHTPPEVKEISDGLQYRDFVTVGLLLKKLKIKDDSKYQKLIEDNWIYIQEPDVLAGRLQIFNNWSPYLVSDKNNVWVGVEYFCYEGDDLWNKPEDEMKKFAAQELDRIGIIDGADVLDATVLKMPKTYPAYFGAYQHFDRLKDYISKFENLFLVGRNGMHKYNNQDHSMLTAMMAVDNIIAGVVDKSKIWEVNTEMEYHEAKANAEQEQPRAAAVGAR